MSDIIAMYDLDPQTMVKQFISKFQPSTDPELWLRLAVEEKKEIEEAIANLLKEFTDLAYILHGCQIVGVSDEAIQEACGPFSELTEDLLDVVPEETLREAFVRVHESNMSKLQPDGSVKRREDGKVLKGVNYREPRLMDLVLDGVTNPIIN
jgi:predicted HAD superfamily Cof-like phosphohydrolase